MEIYQVDAFSDRLFSGNPAAVCPLDKWPDNELMQNIAAENNLAETAFFVKENNLFHIRWFTPEVEVDLCGHATLAAAHVLFYHKDFPENEIIFTSRSGELRVTKNKNYLTLDFPVDDLKEIKVTPDMHSWFSLQPLQAFRGKTDYMLVFDNEDQIQNIIPDLAIISKLKEVRGIIVTSRGTEVDFVSRFFAPQSGISEDPVTGSAHTSLTPYWSEKLNKKEMKAIQLSPRKGFLHCKQAGARVEISGNAKTFFIGKILI